MSFYLSKKITMKEAESTKCLSVNRREGYIVVGGVDGFLKVFKLDHDEDSGMEGRQLVTANTLMKEQILKGHKASIECVEWNEKFKKIISGDAEGKIIVWIMVQNMWYEEMCNQGSQSAVSSIRWSPDAFKICIAYGDGEMIVGSVEGKRLWANNIKRRLHCVQWSPDSRLIVIGVDESEFLLYDCHGLFMKTIIDFKTSPLFAPSSSILLSPSQKPSSSPSLMVDWLKVDQETYRKASLMVAHTDGLCYLMAGEEDEAPMVLKTQLDKVLSCKWSADGSFVAALGVAGGRHYLKLLRPQSGEVEHSLLLPENKVATAFDWDKGGVRLLISLGAHVYFANHRINYKWCCLRDSIVFTYHKAKTLQTVVAFWNTNRHEIVLKLIDKVVSVVGCEDLCCIVTQASDPDDDPMTSKVGSERPGYNLLLTNSISAHFDSKFINLEVAFFSMSTNHIAVASTCAFYVWQFKNFKEFATVERGVKKKGGLEKLLHIDDVASGVGGDNIDWLRTTTPTEDAITCLCVSRSCLVVGRKSGLIHSYNLPNLMLEHKYHCQHSPKIMKLNSDASCLAVISSNEELTFVKTSQPSNNNNVYENNNNNNNNSNNNSFNTGEDGDSGGLNKEEVEKFKLKNTWNIVWAKDDATSFVVMSNTKTQIYNNFAPEESFVSSGYLCSFSDLQLTLTLLDDLVSLVTNDNNLPSKPLLADLVFKHQSNSLRELKRILAGEGYDAAYKFAVDNHHPMLWKILAEERLGGLDLKGTEDCYARASCLHGVHFARKLNNLQNDRMKKAEVEVFLSRFDEAEKIYLSMDRKDLAMAMRKRIGDYDREVELTEEGGGGWMADADKREAYNKLGDHYYDLLMWPGAIAYYREASNDTQLSHCYLNTEDYKELASMTNNLPDNHKLLPELGRTFAMMGMCQEAVRAYLKCDQVQKALDTCVKLNHWSLAVDIGHAHGRKEVDGMLLEYMEGVKDRPFEAVELYRKANHHMKAAHILFVMAEELRKKSSGRIAKISAVYMKKLYLLCSLLMEEHHEKNKKEQRSKTKKKTDETTLILDDLLKDDHSTDTHLVSTAWKCTQAYHFYVLAHLQFYQGDYESCMLTSLHLEDFRDVIHPFDIYSILALSSLACKVFSVCSDAFMRLEGLEDISEEERRVLSELAVQIFYKNNAQKETLPTIKCVSCAELIPFTCTTCPNCESRLVVCIASGRVITKTNAWCCSVCKGCAYEREVAQFKACPLCYQDTVKYAGGDMYD